MSLDSITIPHLIGNSHITTGVGTCDVHDPSTGSLLGKIPLGGIEEVNKAVEVALAAGENWASISPAKRAQYLYKLRDVIKKNSSLIAQTISKEHGKTHDDALGEVVRALEVVEYATGAPQLLNGDFSRGVSTGIDVSSERMPLGVVAGITPFNFPFMVPFWMIPMAIACGNTFILKPSEKCPSMANLIVEMANEAGLPDGVINVVHGDKRAVDALLDHKDISAISFVGSTPIAEYIYHRGCGQNKRVQALGGAKNHLVIMPDADLDQAADALMGAGYGAAGERCMAISVAVPVGQATADALVEKLQARIAKLKVGPCSDKSAEMGPLITSEHLNRVESLIKAGEKEGAVLLIDGRGLTLEGSEGGNWLGACLFDNVEPSMSIYKEEIFGPVLSIVRRNTFDDAMKLIDDNPYANGTSIFTRDGDVARKFSANVKVGMVGVNIPIPVPVGFHSFGGWKSSSFGAHGIYGPEAVHFYTRLKTTTTRWPQGISQGASYSFNSLNNSPSK